MPQSDSRRAVAAAIGAGCFICSLLVSSALIASGPTEINIDLSRDKIGQRPSDFVGIAGGVGDGGTWVVAEETVSSSAMRVISQTSSRDKRTHHYALLVYQGGIFRNIDIAARLNLRAFTQDASAGLVFRYRDPGNYYALEASASSGSVSLYRFLDGKRDVDKRILTDVPVEKWQELRAICKDSETNVYLNGQHLFKANVSQFSKGRVGLWTRADTLVSFANIILVPGEETRILDKIKDRYLK